VVLVFQLVDLVVLLVISILQMLDRRPLVVVLLLQMVYFTLVDGLVLVQLTQFRVVGVVGLLQSPQRSPVVQLLLIQLLVFSSNLSFERIRSGVLLPHQWSSSHSFYCLHRSYIRRDLSIVSRSLRLESACLLAMGWGLIGGLLGRVQG
jgi:hypothetical protein